jgi:hypothetical protein
LALGEPESLAKPIATTTEPMIQLEFPLAGKQALQETTI